MNKYTTARKGIIIACTCFFISSAIAYSVDFQKAFVPFSGDLERTISASTIHYDGSRGGKKAIEEDPPSGVCIGMGDYPCICTNCDCCTTDLPPCKASPVLAGGAYERQDTDFVLQGKGFSYDFTRYYYSSNKDIGSAGLAWKTRLDTGLVIVGDTKASFQTPQSTVAFTGTASAICEDKYTVADNSRIMLIKGELLTGGECYYVVYDYDNERKYIFYKNQLHNDQYEKRGLLQSECDYYNNCWVYTYEDLSENGSLAPIRVDNISQGLSTGVWARFYYIKPIEYTLEEDLEPYVLFEIHDNYKRQWSYSYNVHMVNYQQHVYVFIAVEGAYPRLEYVYGPDGSSTLWYYEYYSRSDYNYFYRARPGFLTSVADRTGRIVAEIDYYTPEQNNPLSHELSRVKEVRNEEGTLHYDYPAATCRHYSNEGFCEVGNKTVNNSPYSFDIDLYSGHIKKVTNPDGSSQQYCYNIMNKIAYYRDESGNYTRYENDSPTGALIEIRRNACPLLEGTCTPTTGACADNELVWNYEYEYDDTIPINMPVKLKTILAS